MPNATLSSKFFRPLLLAAALLLARPFGASAQVTTSSLTGKVSTDQNEELIGVTVLALHVPTGVKRGTATDVDGRFVLPNLAPGGPYEVQISYVGFKTQRVGDVYLTLGNATRLGVILVADAAPAAAATAVAVQTGNTQATKTGAGTTVSGATLAQLPTLTRSIQDFTRLDPRGANNSFAGSSFRYNNVTLDGAINNDAIGFSPSLGGVGSTSGLPGSSARANPIALDAIQEIQVQVAPFDVRLGNFTGGSINAVTRSGTNDLHGSVYGFGRNQAVTGTGVEGVNDKIGDKYRDYQTGLRLGGAVIKNKLFFFGNAEIARRQEPVFYGAGQPGSNVSAALAQAIGQRLETRYGYKAGETGDYTISANSNKLFGRLDFNLNDKTSIALRHNYVGAVATNLERSQTLFKFGSQDFNQNSTQNATVLEVKSNISNTLSNNLVLGYTNIRDFRSLLGDDGSRFPAVQINAVGPAGPGFAGSGQVLLGSDREASIFNLTQRTFEFTDNFTLVRGAHILTLGTHNEFYDIDYGFINAWNGRIDYANVADFLADRPSRVRGSLRNGDNSFDYNQDNPSAAFRLNLLSAYLQDEWQLTDRFKLTPGIRFDLTNMPTKPTLNPLVNSAANDLATTNATYSHTPWAAFSNQFLGQVQFSPRLGFNYDARGDGSLVLRGGSGVFTGRVPLAWLGYAFYNNGVNFNAVDLNNIQTTGINPNADGTPTTTGPNPGQGAGTRYFLNSDPTQIYAQLPASARSKTEVNLIDNDFRMPQVWRSSLALDLNLKTGTSLSVEGLYTKVLQDVAFQSINLKDNTAPLGSGPTQTPRYLGSGDGQRVNSAFSNVFLLTNTQQGYRYQITGSVGQRVANLLDASVAYTYGQSRDISNGIRNSPQSNWELNPARNPNNPALALSNFDLRHRVVASLNLHKAFAERFTGYFTSVLVYQSGAPFTYVYNNNPFGNGQQNVQLAYVPADANDVIIATGPTAAAQRTALNDFIASDPYLSTRRGQYTERNAARTPWNNQADVRLMLETRLGNLTPDPAGAVRAGHTLQVSFDVINVGNLLNNEWGRQYFVPNTFNSTANFGLTQTAWADAAGVQQTTFAAGTFDRPVFNFRAPATALYSIDQLASRWQGQLGVRYSF